MSVGAVLSIASEQFALGRALRAAPECSIELERAVPTGKKAIPYFWVTGDGREAFDAALSQNAELSAFEVLDTFDERTLYHVEWDLSADSFVQMLATHDVVLRRATGDASAWTFHLRFPDSHALSEFHTDCRERGFDTTVDQLSNPLEPETDLDNLTDGQRRLIEHVYEAGYFDVPRRTTLVEVAEELGISDQAVNERLRRGLRRLVETTMTTDTGRHNGAAHAPPTPDVPTERCTRHRRRTPPRRQR